MGRRPWGTPHPNPMTLCGDCWHMMTFTLLSLGLFHLPIWEPLPHLSSHSTLTGDGVSPRDTALGTGVCKEWHQGVLEPVTPQPALPMWWQIQIQMARTLSRSLWASWSRSSISSSRPLLTVTWRREGCAMSGPGRGLWGAQHPTTCSQYCLSSRQRRKRRGPEGQGLG